MKPKRLRRERGEPVGEEFLTTGFFRYSRHPNFFSEQMIWWALYLFSVAAGAPWINLSLLGPFLLTLLLLDRLKQSAPSRIVNVASRAHHRARGIDWDAQRLPASSTGGIDEYSVSKLANVLFTKELARRLAGSGVTAYALHPGVVATDIWRELPWGIRHLAKLFMVSPEEGARTTLHCATEPEASLTSGAYYDSCKPVRPSRAADDPVLARELWRRGVEWTGAPSSS